MDTINIINVAIANAIDRCERNIGLEISRYNYLPHYLIVENDGEVVEDFYDVYEAISFINQMEL